MLSSPPYFIREVRDRPTGSVPRQTHGLLSEQPVLVGSPSMRKLLLRPRCFCSAERSRSVADEQPFGQSMSEKTATWTVVLPPNCNQLLAALPCRSLGAFPLSKQPA